jgi:hypothetical protein
MRRVVENLGLAWGRQHSKLLEEKEKFKSCDIVTVAADGKSRTVMAMPVESFHGWLYTINPNKVAPAVRVFIGLREDKPAAEVRREQPGP